MIQLNELSASELQYLRQKWASEITELDKEIARKLERLESRLENQGESAVAQANLEAELAHAQQVLGILQANNADAAVIASQEAVIAELQENVDSFGLSTSYVSNTDAMLQQMEMDELTESSALRTTKIAEIDAL
jgi:hypothetical protein